MVTVPATIAEQLSVVSAFILFLVGVWAFLKWVLGWAKSLITEQRHEWQEYMKQESEKTRQWLSDQECNNRKSIGQVTEALEAVNDNLRALAEQLTKHDDKVENTFERAVDKLSNGSLYKRPPKKEDGAVK
jgi:gas vesicle protein